MNTRSEVEAEIKEIVEAEIEKALDALHIHPGCSPFYLYLLTGINMPRLNEMVESGHIVRRYVQLSCYYFTPEQIQDRERDALSIPAGCGTHTIVADIRAITACISKVVTAKPTAALALQEARGHLLRASMAVERAMEEPDNNLWFLIDNSFRIYGGRERKGRARDEDVPEIKVSAAITMEYGQDLDKYGVIG